MESVTELNSGETASLDRGLSIFPILVGVIGPPQSSEGDNGGTPQPPPDRIVLLNPITQSMVVLHGDPGLIAELLSGSGRRYAGPPPASKASIRNLKIVRREEEVHRDQISGEDCPVCLDPCSFEEKEIKEMPCGHRFHGECIEKWLGLHGSCPVCRYQMPVEEEEAEAGKLEAGSGGGANEGGRRELWVTLAIGRRDEEGEEQQQRSATQ